MKSPGSMGSAHLAQARGIVAPQLAQKRAPGLSVLPQARQEEAVGGAAGRPVTQAS
jgi:hypothetical protein